MIKGCYSALSAVNLSLGSNSKQDMIKSKKSVSSEGTACSIRRDSGILKMPCWGSSIKKGE